MKTALSLILVVGVLIASADLLQAKNVKFFSEKFQGGQSITVTVPKFGCVDLPRNFWDQSSSVNTNGLCIVLYPNTDCRGRKYAAYDLNGVFLNAKDPSRFDLSEIRMNKRTRSVERC